MSFPNVPNVPGVPAVLRDVNAILSGNVVRLVTDLVDYSLGFQWGIFLFGVPVVLADSIVSMHYRNSSTLSEYPIEQGGFESYDKVNNSFDVQLRFATGGTVVQRQLMLASIDAVSNTLLTYDIVTPEAVYHSVSITGYSYRRASDDGAGLLSVEVDCKEVRVNGGGNLLGSLLGNTLGLSSALQINNGTIQSLLPDVSTVSNFLSSPFS